MLPTEKENPSGLYQRYVITKANGEPVDPEAIYFVLRIDSHGDDWAHIEACRAAARAYAAHTSALGSPQLAAVGKELDALVDLLEAADAPSPDQCCNCDQQAVGYSEGSPYCANCYRSRA